MWWHQRCEKRISISHRQLLWNNQLLVKIANRMFVKLWARRPHEMMWLDGARCSISVLFFLPTNGVKALERSEAGSGISRACLMLSADAASWMNLTSGFSGWAMRANLSLYKNYQRPALLQAVFSAIRFHTIYQIASFQNPNSFTTSELLLS